MTLLKWSLLLPGALACSSRPSNDAADDSADSPLPAVEALADTADPLPFTDLKAAEILRLNERWTGDYDSLGERRFIRALVPFNRTLYYFDKGVQKGIAFESLREFEKQLPPIGNSEVRPKVVIIPTRRDRLFTALAEGYGDIAIGGFTITAEQARQVDFSTPTMRGVKDVVVTRVGTPPITGEDQLSGLEIHVPARGTYHDDLLALNQRLSSRGKRPVVIREVDESLEDEDVLHMVDAGIYPATVAKLPIATFWAKVYDSLQVHEAAVLRSDGELAWAIRKNSPVLTRVVNQFVETHRAGTMFGNVMLRRYLGSAERLKNPAAEAEMRKLGELRRYFETYAKQYDMDWMLVAAQAYQESQFDQSRRSSVGAVGVMQVKPETAADRNVGVADIDQVENNIHAGIKYLRFVADRYYSDSSITRLNRGLFALAAYNAGPGRVRQLRRKAEAAGLDQNVWFQNVEIIAARDIGRETVDYVSNIYKYFVVYKARAAAQDTTSAAR